MFSRLAGRCAESVKMSAAMVYPGGSNFPFKQVEVSGKANLPCPIRAAAYPIRAAAYRISPGSYRIRADRMSWNSVWVSAAG
jgi:hypothetical protein